ncbi:MAG: uncharacterized protein KVP18_001419 [Porospora cf. gigantea A]|uniref:uncharacterized protein n=1 Tax=Porospora cf. gigantea A TaxID=2853593 RepID=UPI00355ABB4A|nr:MAG: hypothetical protein KVP18_001419 [Porospora cf. gigantea A]
MKLLLGLLPVVFAHSCQQENLAILGDPLEVVDVANVNECINVCSRNNDCKAITFKDGKCRVMAEQATTTDVGSLAALGACFGSQGAGEHAAPVRKLTYHACLMEKSWIRGPPISDTTAPNALACAELCHRTSGCQYFVWKNVGSRCVLLSDRSETLRAVYHTSGAMECFHPKLTHTTTAPPFASQCLRQRYSHGDVLGVFAVPDIKGCWLACKTNELCDGFMYHTPYSKCFLMKTVKKTWEAASYVSASKNCLLKNTAVVVTTTAGPAAIIHPCMSWSVLNGVDVGGRPVESADECLRQCTDSSLCAGFSWEWSSKMCNLKVDVTGSQADAGVVSALKACFLPDISGGSDLGDSGSGGSGSGGSGSGGSDGDDDGVVKCVSGVILRQRMHDAGNRATR